MHSLSIRPMLHFSIRHSSSTTQCFRWIKQFEIKTTKFIFIMICFVFSHFEWIFQKIQVQRKSFYQSVLQLHRKPIIFSKCQWSSCSRFMFCERKSSHNEINSMKCNRYWFYIHTIIKRANLKFFSTAAKKVQQFRPLTFRSASVLLLVEMSVWEKCFYRKFHSKKKSLISMKNSNFWYDSFLLLIFFSFPLGLFFFSLSDIFL